MKPSLILLALAWLIAASASAQPVRGDKALEACHLPNYRQEILCGTHTVFEDREAAAGREIELQFAIVPAIGEQRLNDPVVIFAGGPGQSARSLAPLAPVVFSDLIETRDVVLIDQRGMGGSHPLECAMPEDELEEITAAQRQTLVLEALRDCLDVLDADPTRYTQDVANEDIRELLGVLGYDQVNLYGGSWGTRSALLYAHRYPDHVRTIVLDGALPLSNTAPYFAAEDGDRALRATFDACAADERCAAAFPDLPATFDRAMAALAEETPVEVEDPRTGAVSTVYLSAGLFGGLLRGILYIPELVRVVPLMIAEAAQGNYEPLVGVSGYLTATTGNIMTIGASLTIFCSEELARVPDQGKSGDANPLLGEFMLTDLQSACEVWPRAPLPSIYAEDVRTDAPTLILSGEVDPITPPRWGDTIAEAASNSIHLIAPNTGHGVAPVGCAPSLIAQLVDQGSLDDVDGECLEDVARPSFFVATSGPVSP